MQIKNTTSFSKIIQKILKIYDADLMDEMRNLDWMKTVGRSGVSGNLS